MVRRRVSSRWLQAAAKAGLGLTAACIALLLLSDGGRSDTVGGWEAVEAGPGRRLLAHDEIEHKR
jgi:hypothetical protein